MINARFMVDAQIQIAFPDLLEGVGRPMAGRRTRIRRLIDEGREAGRVPPVTVYDGLGPAGVILGEHDSRGVVAEVPEQGTPIRLRSWSQDPAEARAGAEAVATAVGGGLTIAWKGAWFTGSAPGHIDADGRLRFPREIAGLTFVAYAAADAPLPGYFEAPVLRLVPPELWDETVAPLLARCRDISEAALVWEGPRADGDRLSDAVVERCLGRHVGEIVFAGQGAHVELWTPEVLERCLVGA